MTSTRIQPGTFVRHNSLGVGRVIGRDESGGVTVDFKTSETRQMSLSVARHLTALPDDGLEAMIWDGPDKIRPWVEDAPLKLLAATLADIGGTAKASEIKGKLQAHVFGETVKWNSWWERVRVAAGGSKYFKTVRTKKNAINEIGLNLGVDVDDVPMEPLAPPPPKPKPATVSDWERWLLSEIAEPPPGRSPTKAVCGALDKWPAETIGPALDRTIWGARGILTSDSTPPTVAAGWLESVSRASMRWIGCTWPDSDRHLIEQTVELLGRLSQHTEETGLSKFLAGALSGQLGAQRSRFYEERLEQQRLDQKQQRADYETQLGQHQQEREMLCLSYEGQLEQQRLSYESRLEQQRSDQEQKSTYYEDQLRLRCREQQRLSQQVQAFRAQMASGREESRLEIRQGMLLAVGDTLQRAYQSETSAQARLENVIDNLPIALREGGAGTLGTVGETVIYDPALHYSAREIPSGTLVLTVAPGVIVRGGPFGDRMILKANVIRQSESE